MALFKKSSLFKKSDGAGLYKPSKTNKLNTAAKSGGQAPSSDFPTSADQAQEGAAADIENEQFGDASFLRGQRTALTSSNVSWAEYNAAFQTLTVGFHDGGSYAYDGVPPHVATGLLHTDSPGSYVHNFLKGKYRCRRV